MSKISNRLQLYGTNKDITIEKDKRIEEYFKNNKIKLAEEFTAITKENTIEYNQEDVNKLKCFMK